GIQSASSGIEGIPFVLEFHGTTARLWAPSDLYAFQNGNKTELPLEVKVEKEIQPLLAGNYKLNIRRLGTRLEFSLSSIQSKALSPLVPPFLGNRTPAWGPLNIDIQDYNLSNWPM